MTHENVTDGPSHTDQMSSQPIVLNENLTSPAKPLTFFLTISLTKRSLRSRWSLRVRPWITASRYPPASLRLLVIQRMTGATWRWLFPICLRRPCRGPLAAVRLGEQGWRAAPFVPAPTRTGCPLRFSVKGPCPRFAAGRTNPLTLPLRGNPSANTQNRSVRRFLVAGHAPPYCLHVMAHYRLFLAIFQPSRSARRECAAFRACRLADNERSEASASSPSSI